MMQIQVLPFGVLKDRLGASPVAVELPEGATVADLLQRLGEEHPTQWLRGIAVSVNAEFAVAAHVLREGDDVGLLPPVSGGSGRAAEISVQAPEQQPQVTALTREPIRAEALLAAAKRGEDGAVVVFDGIVRDNSHGRQTLHLDYEAYEEMAAKQMAELVGEAHSRFGVRHVTLIHRLGPLADRRNQRADRGGFRAPGTGLRGLPLADRHPQKDRAHLEERDLCGRGRVGGGRAVSGWPDRCAAGGLP